MAETGRKVASLYQSVGLVKAKSGSRMSAIDLEHIIDEIVKSLMQDDGFISVLEWLSTLPAALHEVSSIWFDRSILKSLIILA